MEDAPHECLSWEEPPEYSHSCSTVSSDLSLYQTSTPRSPFNRSTSPPVFCQELMLYETIDGSRSREDIVQVQDDLMDVPKLYYCREPQCQDQSFKNMKDWKRHLKKHDPNAILWQCGCCQNMGYPFKGKERKDKVQSHLRNRHERPKSEDNKGRLCPVEGCYTLFTVASCLEAHFRQEHPSYRWEIARQTTTKVESTCDCSKRVKSRNPQYRHGSGGNKHRAGSPLGAAEKRARCQTNPSAAMQQYSSNGTPTILTVDPALTTTLSPTVDPLVALASTGSWAWPNGNFNFCDSPPQTNVVESSMIFGGRGLVDHTQSTCIDQEWTEPDNIPYVAPFDPPIQSEAHRLVLNNSKPADFLAIREYQGFRDLAISLRTGGISSYVLADPITYNPEKETITLTGLSRSFIEEAMRELRCLLNDFSKHWGQNYLVTSHTSIEPEIAKSRRCASNHSDTQSNDHSERTKVFPIKPKEERLLVRLWFQDILPELPSILSPILGGTYTASLVRRGRNRITAEPCIQVESPRIPGSKARGIIRDSINMICRRNNHPQISIRFSQGSVRNLNGGKDEDCDDAGESAESQRFRFNLVRPYSKPGMGASLGLKCSKKIVATLGGYIFVDGVKYMLTSEHFIAQSQLPENIDGDGNDLETITCPSRFDLNWMENDLKQTKRDLDGEINLLTRQTWGDQEVPLDDRSDQLFPPAEIRDRVKNVTNLLSQVKKSPHEYAVGTVFMRSAEPKKLALAKSLADIMRLPNDSCEAMYHMDWSLCKLNSHLAQFAENRHKYRSDEDAMADDYIDEANHDNQPGDACHEVCEVEAGVIVYYVGQGSKRRSGVVSIPSLVSRQSSTTLDWGILSSDGLEIPYADVAGDSGAWVIKQNGNMLMGQIHSHSLGQVLFTPIDVIFDEIARECGVDVCLPPAPSGSGRMGSTADVQPLCAKPDTPPIRPLKWFFKPSIDAPITPPKTPPLELPPLKIEPPESPRMTATRADANGEIAQQFPMPPDTPPSSPPSLVRPSQPTWLTSGSLDGSPESPPPLDLADHAGKQAKDQNIQLASPTSTMSKFPNSTTLIMDDDEDQAQAVMCGSRRLHCRSHLVFQQIPGARAATWPILRESKIAKVQRWGSSVVKIKVTASTPSVLDRLSRHSCGTEQGAEQASKLPKFTAYIGDINTGRACYNPAVNDKLVRGAQAGITCEARIEKG